MLISLTRLSLFAKLVILFQLLTDVLVILDIVALRQIVGFLYLTFIPGVVVFKILKWDKRDLAEAVVLSVGLSVALIMFSGLLLNEIGDILGFSSPLSALPMLVLTNIIVLLPCLFINFNATEVKLVKRDFYYGIFFTCLPLLSVAGAFLSSSFGSNSILLLMILLIAVLVVLIVALNKLVPSRFFPVALFSITLALLLHQSLISNHLLGYDVHSEYNVFRLTKDDAYWNRALYSSDFRIAKGNDMLSVTILPTFYSVIMNMDGTWVFKIVYPLLLAFLPVALYMLFKTLLNEKAAFLAAFFAISLPVFFNLFAAKQMIAELFLVLLLLVALGRKNNVWQRNLVFIVFSAGLVVSHYSTSYLFLFMILFVWISQHVLQLFARSGRRSRVINLTTVLLFSAFAFSWYLFASSTAAFESLVDTGNFIARNLASDFFNLEARSAPVLRGLGLVEADSIGHQVGRIFFYLAEFFIGVGFLQSLRRKESALGEEYTLFAFFNMIILAMAVFLPHFAAAFRMERFLQLSLLTLAPLCIIGGKTIFDIVLRRKSQVATLNLILLVLIPLFLFQSSFIFEIAKDTSYSIPLSKYRMENVLLFESLQDERDVASAEWLHAYSSKSRNSVYADYTSAYNVLTSYGLMSTENFETLSNTTQFSRNGKYVYLRRLNVVEGQFVGEMYLWKYLWNASEISPQLENLNRIYSNGASEVFVEPED